MVFSFGNVTELLDKTPDLPALPIPVLEAVKLAGDPNTNLAALARAISSDQSLSCRVLKLSNSAYYGLPRQVVTVHEAVTLLGTETVRGVAMVAAAGAWITDAEGEHGFDPKSIWLHSLGVASGAQAIAHARAPKLIDEAFCAGILHNIGKTVLLHWLGEKMALLLAHARKKEMAAHKVERMVLGFDHAEVGFSLGTRWNLPPRLLDAIRYHHEPNSAPEPSPLADMVHISDYLCRCLGIGFATSEFCIEVQPEALDRLGINSPAEMDRLALSLLEKFESARSLLDVA